MYKISQLFVYPIKSMGGISVQQALLTDRGLEHDRRWMLIDESNTFLAQRTLAAMALFTVEHTEQAHAVHYGQVGNNYWTQYIGYIIDLGGYGNKTTNGAGRIAVSEAWGFFIGNTFNAAKYLPLNNNISQSERDQLENQIPVDDIDFQFVFIPPINSSRGWIVFGLMHDMTDNVENTGFTGVTDSVNAYNIQQIFSGLQPGVTTVQGFKNEVLNRNNNLQSIQLNQLVTDYRY